MAATASPTAQLLRSSRLFSLPPALPKPKHNAKISSSIDATSPYATLPYPHLAAIETTPNSFIRGDWGLKRALPLKSTTKTTTPIIRTSGIDTLEHITDFDSAADHSLTLQKWQQMNIPVSVLTPKVRRASGNAYSYERGSGNTKSSDRGSESVFEYKNSQAAQRNRTSGQNLRRWKYDGPWLPGQNEGDFQFYLEKTVRKNRAAFRAFVKSKLEESRTNEARQKALDAGQEFPHKLKLTDKELDSEMIRLRRSDTPRLRQMIWDFLDLPGRAEVLATVQSGVDNATETVDITQPPQTHPSAGLNYRRTGSVVPNHPILGPLRHEEPHQGRILSPGKENVSRFGGRVIFGLGGVAVVERANTFKPQNPLGSQNIDPWVEGGTKPYLQPGRASIDPSGRIKLDISTASPAATAVWKGKQDPTWATSDITKGEKLSLPFDLSEYATSSPAASGFSDSSRIGTTQSEPILPPEYEARVKKLMESAQKYR
ncbi:hypothetical protein MMC25_001879 [Agyrium rufum]|nr:hypothetical protein [Agyrium rufum]